MFAPKSYIGNLGAGSGTTELAASVLALQHGVLPATLNYDEPDPDCPVARARPARRGRSTRPYVAEGQLHRDGPVRRGGLSQVGMSAFGLQR